MSTFAGDCVAIGVTLVLVACILADALLPPSNIFDEDD